MRRLLAKLDKHFEENADFYATVFKSMKNN